MININKFIQLSSIFLRMPNKNINNINNIIYKYLYNIKNIQIIYLRNEIYLFIIKNINIIILHIITYILLYYLN